MAFNFGYRSATIRIYRYIIQDYLEENVYYLKNQTRIDLTKAVFNIKRQHAI
jgi:hypothetical protein